VEYRIGKICSADDKIVFVDVVKVGRLRAVNTSLWEKKIGDTVLVKFEKDTSCCMLIKADDVAAILADITAVLSESNNIPSAHPEIESVVVVKRNVGKWELQTLLSQARCALTGDYPIGRP